MLDPYSFLAHSDRLAHMERSTFRCKTSRLGNLGYAIPI